MSKSRVGQVTAFIEAAAERCGLTPEQTQIAHQLFHAAFVEAAEESSGKNQENLSDEQLELFSDLGVKLIFTAQKFHVWHVNTDLLSKHTELEDIYNRLNNLGDELLENVHKHKYVIKSRPDFGEWSPEYSKEKVCNALDEIIKDIKDAAEKVNVREIGLQDVFSGPTRELESLQNKLNNYD